MTKNYKLLEVLGKGSFGMVVKARCRKNKEEVAIKYVNCKNNDVIEYKNIIRELQLLTQFSEIDKNIFTTKLHDVIIIQEEKSAKIKGIFFVMEYMPNDLKKMIQDNNPLHFTEQHIKVILYNLLCSLNFIHTSNVMHRDIKPANILIDMKCTVKICDFGSAKILTESG